MKNRITYLKSYAMVLFKSIKQSVQNNEQFASATLRVLRRMPICFSNYFIVFIKRNIWIDDQIKDNMTC